MALAEQLGEDWGARDAPRAAWRNSGHERSEPGVDDLAIPDLQQAAAAMPRIALGCSAGGPASTAAQA